LTFDERTKDVVKLSRMRFQFVDDDFVVAGTYETKSKAVVLPLVDAEVK
jgi:hypothetical protein